VNERWSDGWKERRMVSYCSSLNGCYPCFIYGSFLGKVKGSTKGKEGKCVTLRGLSVEGPEVKVFYLFAGPVSLAQKGEAGLDAGVRIETVNVYAGPQAFPAEVVHQLYQNTFQRFTVQRVVFLFFHSYGAKLVFLHEFYAAQAF
jgi:hypothetical protein